MPTLQETTTVAETAACRSSASPCNACLKRRGEHVASASIHSYGSQPRAGWVARRTAEEAANSPTFGVELELQFARSDRYDPTGLTGEEGVAVASPRGWWHAQHDGSVSGPEMASQPGSLAYWRSIRPSVAAMMRTLIHGGLRSHDGPESCSMHVNIGRQSFTDAEHLARFIRLATVNPKWTTKMAQRTHEQVRSWARYDAFPDMDRCQRLARSWWRDNYASTGHGSAVNLENSGRVEFRSPRGTLRVDRFYAKLEWVAAMVEFTRDATVRPAVGNFVPWAVARRGEYPELVAYMLDMTPGRLTDRPTRSTADAASRTTSARTDSREALYATATETDAERRVRLEAAWPEVTPDSDDRCLSCDRTWSEHSGTLCPTLMTREWTPATQCPSIYTSTYDGTEYRCVHSVNGHPTYPGTDELRHSDTENGYWTDRDAEYSRNVANGTER